MGLFDFLLGNREVEQQQQTGQSQSQVRTGSTRGTEQSDRTSTTNVGSTGSGSQVSRGTTRILDADTLGIIQRALPGLATNIGAANTDAARRSEFINKNAEVFDTLRTRAGGADQFAASLIPALQAETKRSFELEQLAPIFARAGAVGSTDNSYIDLLRTTAGADLETRLAALDASTRMAGRQQGTNELVAAAGVGSQLSTDASRGGESAVSNFVNLAGLAKGAVSETTGATETETEQKTLQSVVDTLISTKIQESIEETLGDLMQQMSGTTYTPGTLSDLLRGVGAFRSAANQQYGE